MGGRPSHGFRTAPTLSPTVDDLVAEQALGLLDAALQVADRVHLAEVDADGDQRLRDLRATGR